MEELYFYNLLSSLCFCLLKTGFINRTQQVQLGQKISKIKEIKQGVPQGSNIRTAFIFHVYFEFTYLFKFW